MPEYRLNDPQKGIIGPIGIATVRDLIEAGVIHKDILVSRDNGPFLPVANFQEIGFSTSTQQALKPTYAGDIGKNTFFKVFYRLHLTRSTGLLVVRDDTRRKDIYLEDGQPVFVLSNIPYERLGEYLCLHALLERHELDVALASIATDDHRLGETLLRLGLLEPQELAEALKAQQMTRLVDVCLWEFGRYLFFEGKRHAGARVELGLAVPELIMHAAREMPERALLRRVNPHYYKIVRPTPRLAALTSQLAFSAAEHQVLKNLDGQRTVAELASIFGREEGLRRTALMIVYLLWEVDAITYESKQSAAASG